MPLAYTSLPVPGEVTDQWDDKLVLSLQQARDYINALEARLAILEAQPKFEASTVAPTDGSVYWLDIS